MRVTANGARSYVFERRLHGRTVRVTIGSVEDWKLGAARSRARELAVTVDKGCDPRLEAAAARAQAEARRVEVQRGALSVSAAWRPTSRTARPRGASVILPTTGRLRTRAARSESAARA